MIPIQAQVINQFQHMQFSIGTDIGGTNSVIGIVDKKGVILFEASVPTKIFRISMISLRRCL